MTYQKVEDLTELALREYTPSQFREKGVYTHLLSAITLELQKVEDTLWAMYKERSLSTAIGVQLDHIGGLLQVIRLQDESDDDYRIRIYAQIFMRRADTTADTIMSAIEAVYGISDSSLWEHYSGHMTGGIVVCVASNKTIPNATKILKDISATTIGSVSILEDQRGGLSWTPVEVVADEVYLVDEDENIFITNGVQNITVTTKTGSTLTNLVGSLNDGSDLYGFFAEVSQIRMGQNTIEGNVK